VQARWKPLEQTIPKKNVNGKNRRAPLNKSPAPRSFANLESQAYKGQQKAVLMLTGASSLLATSGGGTIAQAIQIASSLITGFSTRFGNSFDEYRILSCKVHVCSVSGGSGLSAFWFDEKSTSSPTLNNAQERTILDILVNNCANSKSSKTFSWRARDLLDLNYTPIGTAVTPVTFKVYTDSANYDAGVSQNTWFIQPELLIEFRGISSN